MITGTDLTQTVKVNGAVFTRLISLTGPLKQAEAANEQANFLACAGIYTEQIDPRFLLENLLNSQT